MTTVLVADDHPMFRDGLVAALRSLPDVEVVGEHADGRSALEGVLAHAPDVAVLDIDMPEMNGVDACRAIARAAPGTRVLVLTMMDTDASISAALRAGARGYLLKGADRSEIARALTVLVEGGIYLPAAVAARVPTILDHTGDRPFPDLSPREHEVLELVATGLSNSAIAARLFLSPKTVRNLVSTVLTKIHADDRLHAIELARGAGLGRPLG